MKTLTTQCKGCHEFNQVDAAQIQAIQCSKCQKPLGDIEDPQRIFDSCPICHCRQFYLMKDFNQFFGCLIMLCGIALVPFTFGISLPVFALIDWVLYKKVETIIMCYRCAAEFRGFKEVEGQLKPFIHAIGLKYDKHR